MSATKIINVHKNDNFEDVFDLIRKSDAGEVILIFPKGSRFARSGRHFEDIKSEADSLGKTVSVMTTDPVVAGFANENNLELLSSPRTGRSAKTVDDEVAVLAVQETPAVAALDQWDNVSEGVGEVLLAAAKRGGGQTLRDVITPEPDRSVDIEEERHKTHDVEIKRDIGGLTRSEALESIWAHKPDHKSSKSWGDLFNKPRVGGKPAYRSGRRNFKKTGLISAIVLIALLGLVSYIGLSSAQIIIRPHKQPVNFNIKVSASTNLSSADTDLNRIPGQRFALTKDASAAADTTGQKDVVQKAGGKITIFNTTQSDQRLVATTRFESSNGLVFRIPNTINVPAATGTGSQRVPGSVESQVYADKAGKEYNIGPGKFTIPGFEGTPKFDEFYAESASGMVGGHIGPARVVTEDDFIKTQESLHGKLKAEVAQSLRNQVAGLGVIEPLEIKFAQPETNANVGEAADKLQMKISASADTIAFRDSDIRLLIDNYLVKNGNLEILEDNLNISFTESSFENNGNVLSFNVKVSGMAAARLDSEKILNDIIGMKENAIRSYFADIKEIESTRIILSPFWVNSIPKDPSKVKIKIDK